MIIFAEVQICQKIETKKMNELLGCFSDASVLTSVFCDSDLVGSFAWLSGIFFTSDSKNTEI